MGIHKLPSMRHYWSTDPILGVLPKSHPNHDKLHKVRPLVEKLNQIIKTAYRYSNITSIDESMIKFKGRSSLKQFMPLKPTKRGYKVWVLADSKTGYVLKFELYTGKSTTNDSLGDSLGERVVLNLTKDLRNSDNLVVFDNFFISVSLMYQLQARKIFAVGIVRTNQAFLFTKHDEREAKDAKR